MRERESEISVSLEWSPQMLEHHAVLDTRGGAGSKAEDSEEMLTEEVG